MHPTRGIRATDGGMHLVKVILVAGYRDIANTSYLVFWILGSWSGKDECKL